MSFPHMYSGPNNPDYQRYKRESEKALKDRATPAKDHVNGLLKRASGGKFDPDNKPK